MNRPKQRFVIVVSDGNGPVDISHYEPDSLREAAIIGHAFQTQSDRTVMIIDRSNKPYKRYTINLNGEPIRL